jgi:hypothetical protein
MFCDGCGTAIVAVYAVSFYQRAIAPSGGRTAESFTLDTYVGLLRP